MIECICSNESIHRARLKTRQRHIPGWYELEWADIERVRTYYAQWNEPRLIIDCVSPFDINLEIVLEWLMTKKETSQ